MFAAAVHATIPDLITFVVAAAIVLSGAIGVVIARNPVHAALSLVLTLFGIAVLFVELSANFIAVIQVIVYAGAIVVLFLFVIMFLGVDRQENVLLEPLRGQRPLAAALIVISLGGVIALAVTAHWISGAHTVVGPIHGPHGEVGEIGRQLFTNYLYAFEATAGLLVIAVVGAVVLARRPPAPDSPDEPELEEGPEAIAGPGGGDASDADTETGTAVEAGAATPVGTGVGGSSVPAPAEPAGRGPATAEPAGHEGVTR